MLGLDFLLEYSYTTTIVLIVTFILWIIWSTRRPEGLPPGPTPFPIIGNIPSLLDKDTRRAFATLRQQYGDVYSLVIGSNVLIIVNGIDAMKEMFIKNGDMFSNRPTNLIYSQLTKGRGIIDANGESWKELRRFSLSTLRDFGMGRVGMEERIASESEVLIEKMRSQNGKEFDPSHLLACCVSNVVCSVLFGETYDHDDEAFVFHLNAINRSAKKLGNASFFTFFPILKYFFLKSVKKSKNKVKYGINYKAMKQHFDTYDENNMRDYIDVFIKQWRKYEQEGTQTALSEENLLQILGEFFFAGTETLTTTFRWALIYLALYPQHQAAVQEELDRVIGRNRKPKVSDKKDLPVVEATILEIQRMADVVPFSVPHGAAQDTVFRGYHIPTTATILPNLSSVLYSKDIWGDPEVFRPSRFLEDDNKSLKRDVNIPFSLGKRICLGESLAKMELFIFLTTLLQSFTFSLPEGQSPPCLHGVLGITRSPRPYKIIATPRD